MTPGTVRRDIHSVKISSNQIGFRKRWASRAARATVATATAAAVSARRLARTSISLIIIAPTMPHPARRAYEAVYQRPVVAFGAGLALLLAILFFDPLFLGKTFVSRDLIPFFFPIEKAVHEA